MKRSDFIKKVLKSKHNTVFTTKEQVENSLEIFESLGMLPPALPKTAKSFLKAKISQYQVDWMMSHFFWEDQVEIDYEAEAVLSEIEEEIPLQSKKNKVD